MEKLESFDVSVIWQILYDPYMIGCWIVISFIISWRTWSNSFSAIAETRSSSSEVSGSLIDFLAAIREKKLVICCDVKYSSETKRKEPSELLFSSILKPRPDLLFVLSAHLVESSKSFCFSFNRRRLVEACFTMFANGTVIDSSATSLT